MANNRMAFLKNKAGNNKFKLNFQLEVVDIDAKNL